MSPRDLPSRTLYQGRDRAGARSFLYAIGLAAEDIGKPFVGVSNVWTETMPCNFGLRDLTAPLKKGIKAAGANPMEFNTVAISDGITMGTQGMKTSLVSRELIADSIELVARGHMFDAVVALSGCDKTILGCVMALARMHVPILLLNGVSFASGRFATKESLENSIACVAATGGTTNAVLHLMALAREAGVTLKIDEFDSISGRTPLLADLKPGGRYVAADLYRAGGVRVVAQRLK